MNEHPETVADQSLDMQPPTPVHDLENDIAQLLVSLTGVQEELLEVLRQKRDMMVQCNTDGMRALQPREEALNGHLQELHDRRGELLQRATDKGIRVDTLRQLAAQLPHSDDEELENQVREVSDRMRLLQHQSLTNWVLAQRSLLHVSQLLEIVATGGRFQPTYGKGEPVPSSGALVDRVG